MKTADSCTYRVWVAGDYREAVNACREFCEEGLCVSVAPVAYVYTGGMEDGVCVTLINYPRFPRTSDDLRGKALRLADHLRARLFQDSYTVEGPSETQWFTRRQE